MRLSLITYVGKEKYLHVLSQYHLFNGVFSILETKVDTKPKAVASLKPSNVAAAAISTKPSTSASTVLTNSTITSSLVASAGTSNSAFPSSEKAANTKAPSGYLAKNEKTEEEEDELQKKSSPSTKSTKESANTNSETDSVDTASVRSILSRAKNILKTLDIGGSDSRKKRFRIARPDQSAPSTRSFNKQQQQWSKKMMIASKNKKQTFIANQQKLNEYPDNFILKSWYGK